MIYFFSSLAFHLTTSPTIRPKALCEKRLKGSEFDVDIDRGLTCLTLPVFLLDHANGMVVVRHFSEILRILGIHDSANMDGLLCCVVQAD